jgi:cytochrome c-type biogenesis protein CcmH/NrfG
LQPDYPEAIASKATALIALARLPEALAALDHAIRLRPGRVETLYRRA